MLKLNCEILVYDGSSDRVKFTFEFVHDIEIISSYDQLTDTCTIVLPRNINFVGENAVSGIDSLFKRGDKIDVNVGYDGNLVNRFKGFVLKVDLELPIKITCEDFSYILKKKVLTKKSYSTVSTSELIKHIVGKDVKYVVTSEQTLGQFIIQDGVTALQVLKYLNDNHKIYSWFRGDTLYVGLAFVNDLRQNRVYDTERNIITNNLQYNIEEDISIKVKATSVNQKIVGGKSKEEKIVVFYPDEKSEGSVRSYSGKMNIDEASLRKEAKAFFESLKFDGYTGTFETFGAPAINHGDSVNIINNEFPEQNNTRYLVKSVKTNFGVNGYRNTVELGGKING
jgi:hypothetical protein